ncbi:serine hydrolase [Winogradskyella aurantiaca]|uniref:serine hydrolase n=1 Tax=Winogradskyella aurantiaca TaxID=2219558 RepID=UPI001E33EC40|nr:serine hydrolase [Winogradskyella aurantiaca]
MAFIDKDSVSTYYVGSTQLDGGSPVDGETVYEIGSISKVFTAIILAQEVVDGRMNLEDPAQHYLPSTVTMPSRNGQQITLNDLATHSSGLPRLPNNMTPADALNPYADYTVEQLYSFLNSYTLPRDIGAQYEYSNLAMGLLSHILELHTGQSYEELVLERIAKPLGMTNTRVVLTDNMKAHLALGHNEQMQVTSNWDLPTLAGAGAIRSTTNDMVKFIMANMNPDDSSLGKAMALSHKIAYGNPAQNFEMGLAWHYTNNNSIVWHNGGTGGYRAFTGFNPEAQTAVVLMTNSVQGLDALGVKLLGQELTLELPKKRVFPEEVTLSDEVLVEYLGEYALSPDFSIKVFMENDQLYGQGTGQGAFELFASAKDEFFLKAVEASASFQRNEAGEITGFILHQNGQDIPATKMKMD